jgi:hypothetical protein
MKLRALVLIAYFGLIAMVGFLGQRGAPTNEPADSLFDLEINVSRDNSRVAISVFNARANNILVNRSYRDAEASGDLEVRFSDRPHASDDSDRDHSAADGRFVEWLTIGSGIGWSLPKSFWIARYGLPPGCHAMEVRFFNRAAVKAAAVGNSGPVAEAAIARRRVCF